MDIASFAALKLAIVKTTGLSKDALHIHIGLLVFCLGCLVLRKPLRAWTPLLWVALMVGVGEWLDRRDNLASMGKWLWDDSVHDALNTLFWPAVVMTVARLSHAIGVQRRRG